MQLNKTFLVGFYPALCETGYVSQQYGLATLSIGYIKEKSRTDTLIYTASNISE